MTPLWKRSNKFGGQHTEKTQNKTNIIRPTIWEVLVQWCALRIHSRRSRRYTSIYRESSIVDLIGKHVLRLRLKIVGRRCLWEYFEWILLFVFSLKLYTKNGDVTKITFKTKWTTILLKSWYSKTNILRLQVCESKTNRWISILLEIKQSV